MIDFKESFHFVVPSVPHRHGSGKPTALLYGWVDVSEPGGRHLVHGRNSMNQSSWKRTNYILKQKSISLNLMLPISLNDFGLLQFLTGIVFILLNIVDLH